jgi:Putative beta-lactamase-inhibitor-like, PepSY-like
MLKNLVFIFFASVAMFSCTKDTNDVVAPQEVETAFRAQYPQAEDVSISELPNGMYEVAFVHNYGEFLADFDVDGVLHTVSRDHNHDGSHDSQDRHKHDVINVDSLCDAAKMYIATNYAGYTIDRAYKTNRDSLKSILVLISNDTSKVRLVFDLDCNFIKVATGHVGGGHHGNGNHGGGHHGNGGNNGNGHGEGHGHGSPVNLDSLPASVLTYVQTNYSGYELHKAKKLSKDGVTNYVVVVKNADGTYKKLLFDLNGIFIKEL